MQQLMGRIDVSRADFSEEKTIEIELNGQQEGQLVGGTYRTQLEEKMLCSAVEGDGTRRSSESVVFESTTSFFHELKNIVAVLKGFLQIFAMNPKYTEDLPKFDLMNQEVERLYQMALTYLGMAKNALSVLAWIDLGRIVQEVQLLLKEIALSRAVYIKIQITPGPKIWGNAFEVRQMVLNLTKNGMEAMEGGGTLYLEAGILDGHRVLVVQDEGTGLPVEVCQRFGEFVESGKCDGNGVGLAFCRRVLEACRADCWVETGEKGSCFRVVFPTEGELKERNMPNLMSGD